MSGNTWHSTACVLCSNNCGIEVQVENDRIVKVRADKKNPFSRGYVCGKSLSVGAYKDHNQRVLSPIRRRADGSFESIEWNTAATEIAAKLKAILDRHGPRALAFTGGGGQANHLDVPYALFFMRALGSRFFYNALGQEYTQKYWINGLMFGSQDLDFHPDERRCEVLLVIGSNPWMSNRFQRARMVINEISKDRRRKLIVVDPRRHETARKADIFLQIKPGTDVYLLLALINVIVKEGLTDERYIAEHTSGWNRVRWIADLVTPEIAAQLCDLEAAGIREVARTFGRPKRAATYVDLGICHNIYMIENLYLERVLLAITGNLGVPGGAVFPESFMALDLPEGSEGSWKTRVAAIPEIRGMFPPAALPEEILTPAEERIRAVFVEGCNPLRSYPDSNRFEEAFKALDLLAVIDPAMSEAARLAHYVLPAKCGYEKFEAVFFPKGFPQIYYHLRHPVVRGPGLAKQECEIFLMILEKMGVDLSVLPPFALLEQAERQGSPAPVLSIVRLFSALFAAKHRQALIERGIISGRGEDGEELFQAILDHPEGMYLCDTTDDNNLENLKTADGKIHLAVDELLDRLRTLEIPEAVELGCDRSFPFVLQTGERIDYNANTIQRDNAWRAVKMPTNYLRVNSRDAERLGISNGETVRIVTPASSASIPALVTDDIFPGNLSIPHGFGMLHPDEESGELRQVGVNVNELIASSHREPFCGIPLQKHIPCRIEKEAG